MEEENKKEEIKKEEIEVKEEKQEQDVEKNKESFFTKKTIITFVIGLLMGLLLMFLINLLTSGNTVAKVNGKTISKDEIYKTATAYTPIEVILSTIDNKILDENYKLDDATKKEIEDEAQEYLKTYEEYYGYTEEEFLAENGFETYEEFIADLSLYYKRNLYYYNYVATLVEEGAVEKYYNENAFGKIDSKHILVQTSDDLDDEGALKLSKEIISKLNKGKKFDEVATEYENNYPANIVVEELGYIDFSSSIEESYVDALKTLEKNTYTKTPVETSYGYHVIYCIDKIEKGEMTTMDRMNILSILAQDMQDVEDYNAILIKMREENGLKFYDEYFDKKYKEFCEEYQVVE